MARQTTANSRGVSIGEIILIVLLISILAIIIVPNYVNIRERAQWEVCLTNVSNMNALVQLYYIKEGTWPDINLSNIKTNISYFPEATLPDCPVTPSPTYYSINTTTHRVTGHLKNDSSHP